MSTSILTHEQWQVIRDMVWEASWQDFTPDCLPEVPESLLDHPVVTLVHRYATERQSSILDEAAKLVALAKPGIDRQVAERDYWLVIEKS